MPFFRTLFLITTAAMIVSCGNDKTKENTLAAADTTANKGFDPKAHADSMLANNPVLSTTNNTLSPYKFVTTTTEYSKFGVFVKASSYAKDLHNSDWALLAPTDMSLEKFDVNALSMLRLPENKKLLDEFVARHIIKMPFSIYKLTDLKEVETITGEKIKVDEKTLTIGGCRYSGVEFNTNIGRVISMDEPSKLPINELEKLLLKSNKGQKTEKQ